MGVKHLTTLTVLGAAALHAGGARVQADFSYSTSITIDSITAPGTFVNTAGVGATGTFGGTTVIFGDHSRGGFIVPSVNTINIGDVTVTSTTAPPPEDSFSIHYTDVFTLTNTPPPGSAATGVFTIHGILTVTGVNTGTGTVSNTFLSPFSASGVLGGVFFAGSADDFGNPTINGAPGNLGGTLAASVPEPCSVALLASGLVGAWGVFQRRAILQRQQSSLDGL